MMTLLKFLKVLTIGIAGGNYRTNVELHDLVHCTTPWIKIIPHSTEQTLTIIEPAWFFMVKISFTSVMNR